MRNFFYPDSIAVFGVSADSKNLGRIIIENLVHFGYKGNVYPIGSKEGMVAGKNILKGLHEITKIPDLAVILVPARFVPATVKQCGEKGINSIIIESGGFSEFADERNTLEEEIKEISAEYSINIAGPNCFGVVSLEKGIVLPFFIIDPEYVRQGTVSLISQSGGIFYDTCMYCSCENIGLNKLISIGNKLMVNENEVLEYLTADPKTGIIGLYLENFVDGRRFMDIAAQTIKPIVLIKANRSPAGNEIARFHTTALAGDDEVADAALKQAGVHRVQNFQDMIDCFKIFRLPSLKGKKLAVISRSGGHGVLSADAVSRYDFELAELSEQFFKTVGEKKLNIIRATNPLDVGDVYDLDDYTAITEAALKEKGIDGVVFVITYSSESDGIKIHNFICNIKELASYYDKPVTICVITNRNEWLTIKGAADYPVFADVDVAVKALSTLYSHYTNRHKLDGLPINSYGKTISINSKKQFVHPESAFSMLKSFSLPVADYTIINSEEEALNAAAVIGYPVVLKTAAPEALHKTDTGGVKLGLVDSEALIQAYREINSTECLIQKMSGIGIEVIVGARHDREFGHILLFGLGGIFTEVFKDRSIRILPVNDAIAEEMIMEIKGSALLKGFRGKPPADIDALKNILVRISAMITEHPEITDLDINPVIVFEKGQGCMIVDIKIRMT